METHPKLTAILFFLLCHITIASSAPLYMAVDNITLSCGTSGNTKAADQREWVGDLGSKFFPTEESNHKSITSPAQSQASVNIVPYKTARLSYFPFTYVFPVTPGPKFVRLYFYSTSYSGFEKSKDYFTVKAGSFTLLKNFSASDSLGKETLIKEFCINVEKNQKLNLTFIPFPSNYYAFINGIEIVSMPIEYMYYSPQGFTKDELVPKYVGQALQFFINYSMALEMLYRLNLGENSISAMADTGMFREWSDGINYLWSEGSNPSDPTVILNYSKIPNYTALDTVYHTTISMGSNSTMNSVSNLTWELPVDTGFDYLVRLHFCEIDPMVNLVSSRDYVVKIQNNKDGEKKHILSIDLHPRTDPGIIYWDAILNGVEVFKLSDSDGNLVGPSMASPLLDQQPALTANKFSSKKTIFIAIGSGVGFLLVLTLVCCMVLWKSKKTKRYGSYHPQPKWWCWPYPYKQKLTRTKASSLPEVLCRYFTVDELKRATNNFNEELIIGEGGFGNVYKGVIEQGNMTAAIKRLQPESQQGAQEFRTEIEMLSQLRH
ncbi:receptor-like protein kinase FERONIA isoform X1, partial [Fagus crenata]